MTGDGSTIKSRIRNLLRSPSTKYKNDRKESLATKVTLERVLGITASGSSGLACHPRSGLVAYPAGCVVVLLDPKKNRQHHIINTSRKTITALSFSPDGKHLVTGECGHLPAVRVWDVAERKQVAELQEHKYGVSCVAFSPNSKYIVSVGNQHDMLINVWAWKKDVIVAANKVSSKVTAVSFSEDNSYFVTAGNRHVKFWYLDHSKPIKASAPVPLLGRSGLLGELRNNFFCDVACGRGPKSDSTFCITSSGLLCEFNSKRMLDKWVDLQTGMAQSLSVSEELIFCGCADGTVRAFSPADLGFVCTLPRPHPLGTDVSAVTQASHLFSTKMAARYPDTIAVTYDPISHWLSCVYNDHSLYVWDVREVHRVGKVHSALYHSACVWDLQMFPEVHGGSDSGLSSGVFLSCSADNTIRLWCMDGQGHTHTHTHNVLSNDLLKVVYMDENTATLLDSDGTACVNTEKAADGPTVSGIRTICVSPDGKHLASGDRNGMLRVHDLGSMEEILKVEAHDAEILCLEYSKPETGLKLLATASRDRLIHVLDAEEEYGLVQTLDEHSSSITAVRFAANDNKVRMISCGADKSIYFRTAHRTEKGTEFRRSHHVVRKTTLYDMGVDPTCKYAAVGCQDRCIRIFNISSGKQRKLFKGSLSEDGSLLRVEPDPSGQYVATSCSDKNISIFHIHSGECVATMFGHSEIVTGLKFTNDCKHLISVSGDSCIFVWRLAPELIISMRERLCQLRRAPSTPPCQTSTLRRETYSAPTLAGLSSESDHEHEEGGTEHDDPSDPEEITTNTSSDSSHGEEDTAGSDEGPEWESNKRACNSPPPPEAAKRPRRRWSYRMGSLELMVKSMLDLRQLETFSLTGSSSKKSPASHLRDRDAGSTSSLQETAELEERAKKRLAWAHTDWLTSHTFKGSKGTDGAVLYPEGSEDNRSLRDSDYLVKEQHRGPQGRGSRDEGSQDSCSPDSALSMGYDSREASLDQARDVSDGVESLSSGHDSSDEEREEEEEEGERKRKAASMDEAIRTVTDALDHSQEGFLKQNFETLAVNSSNMDEQSSSRLSISSCFLARGYNNRRVPLFAKTHDREPGAHSAKPPVSKVRPLMEGGQGRSTEDGAPLSPGRIEGTSRVDGGVAERAPELRSQAQKKRSPGGHLRLSNPGSRTPLLGLPKSQSVHNLASDPLHSPAPSSGGEEVFQRPQLLFVDREFSRAVTQLPSPSSASPQSPQLWESPKLKSQHSYMNPTTSSMAKTSRSSSVGEGIQLGTPPGSSPLPPEDASGSPKSRRSSGLLEAEPPFQSTSPPCVTVPPNPGSAFPTNVPPSRIPLPKQPLSPRRSLPDWSGGHRKSSTPPGGPGCDGAPVPGYRQSLAKRLSLSKDPAQPSSLPVKQRRGSASESLKEPGQAAVSKERPLVSVQAYTLSTASQSGLPPPPRRSSSVFLPAPSSATLPLHHSVSLPLHLHHHSLHHCSPPPSAFWPMCPSVCPSQPPLSLSVSPSHCHCCCRRDQSITLETCRQAVAELQNSVRRTALLYNTVLSCGPEPSEGPREMRRVLSEALGLVRAELDSLPLPTAAPLRGVKGEAGVEGEGDRALALLEQYSELLLKSVEKRLDNKT